EFLVFPTTKSLDRSLDLRAGSAECRLKVPAGVWGEGGCGNSGQVGRKGERCCAVIKHERTISAQRSDEQSKFEKHIVSRRCPFVAAQDGQVAGGEHQR